MPRSLVLSNGRLFLAVDSAYRIRELTYPHVGQYNHLSGNSIRLGVWVNGAFSWVDDEGWSRSLAYADSALVAECRLTNEALQLEISTEEWISPEVDTYVRHLQIRDLTKSVRDVRLFQTQRLPIAESDIGDCSFFDPILNAMVHFKDCYAFALGSSLPLKHYAAGVT